MRAPLWYLTKNEFLYLFSPATREPTQCVLNSEIGCDYIFGGLETCRRRIKQLKSGCSAELFPRVQINQTNAATSLLSHETRHIYIVMWFIPAQDYLHEETFELQLESTFEIET